MMDWRDGHEVALLGKKAGHLTGDRARADHTWPAMARGAVGGWRQGPGGLVALVIGKFR